MNARNDRQAAFTLVELVLAIGITAVLAALLLSIVTNTLGIWQRGAASMQAEDRGGLVLERLERDLRGWTWLRGAARWQEDVAGNGGLTTWRFLSHVGSTSPDDEDVGGIRVVGYSWDAAGQRLYRWETGVLESLDSGYALTTGTVSTDAEWLLAEGVHDLQLRWMDANGTETTNATSGAVPTAVRIELTLMDDEGQVRLAAQAAGRSTESVVQIELETTRTLVRWVQLTGGGSL